MKSYPRTSISINKEQPTAKPIKMWSCYLTQKKKINFNIINKNPNPSLTKGENHTNKNNSYWQYSSMPE